MEFTWEETIISGVMVVYATLIGYIIEGTIVAMAVCVALAFLSMYKTWKANKMCNIEIERIKLCMNFKRVLPVDVEGIKRMRLKYEEEEEGR